MSQRPIIGITSRIIRTETFKGEAAHLPYWAVRANYAQAVEDAGGIPLFLPLTADETALRQLFSHVRGVVIPGGEDVSPECYGEAPEHNLRSPCNTRDRVELLFARWAFENHKPLFVICRGMQLLNVALGGTLYQDLPAQFPGSLDHGSASTVEDWHKLSHEVHLTTPSRIAELLGTDRIMVNSLHHQAIRELGRGLKVVGRSTEGVIEAIEAADDRFVIGVQSHPEMLCSSDTRWMELFRAFTQACKSDSTQDSPTGVDWNRKKAAVK